MMMFSFDVCILFHHTLTRPDDEITYVDDDESSSEDIPLSQLAPKKPKAKPKKKVLIMTFLFFIVWLFFMCLIFR